jgi:hypothetical protein
MRESLRERTTMNPEYSSTHPLSRYWAGTGSDGCSFATRLSRRGANGDKSYVYLFLHHPDHGLLQFEQDDVPLDAK